MKGEVFLKNKRVQMHLIGVRKGSEIKLRFGNSFRLETIDMRLMKASPNFPLFLLSVLCPEIDEKVWLAMSSSGMHQNYWLKMFTLMNAEAFKEQIGTFTHRDHRRKKLIEPKFSVQPPV